MDTARDLDTALPVELRLGLLAEDLARDQVTARRATLLALIWHESFLSSAGLMARTEAELGPGCFGKAAEATFRRDMRALRAVLAANDFRLMFSRRTGRSGYYISGRPELSPELMQSLQDAASEIDARQIQVDSRLTPAERIHQAGQLSDAVRRLAVLRLMADRPDLTLSQAQQEVLNHHYRLGG